MKGVIFAIILASASFFFLPPGRVTARGQHIPIPSEVEDSSETHRRLLDFADPKTVKHVERSEEPIIRLKGLVDPELQEARQEARQKARALLVDRGVEFIDGYVPKVWWTFYGGPLSERRAEGLKTINEYALKRGLKHIHVTFDNIHEFEVAEWHPVFEDSLGANEKGLPKLLSGNHISDYFRTYIGYYFGGWYSDVKPLREGVEILDYLENMAAADKSLTGFIEGSVVAYSSWAAEMVGAPVEEVKASVDRLICNGTFGTRPGSVIFSRLVDINDKHLTLVEETLRQHPAEMWRCCQHATEYPIQWANLYGNVLHSLEYLHPEEMHIIRNMNCGQAYDMANYK